MLSARLKSTSLKSMGRASTALGALFVLAATLPAQAQVETVVVTAERHTEDVQFVPESVTTIPDDELKSMFQSGQDIRAIAARVPSLYAESSNGRVAPRFYIRGLGNADFDLAASQPVSIIEDGIVEENVVLKSAPLYDVGAVEVDRGPQGTLFGRNTTAGIVKFTSVAPGDKLEGYANASYGELGTADVDAALTIPLTDTLSVRASGIWQHRDDYIDNAFLGVKDALGGYDERAGRIQVLWKPSDDFSVLLNVHGRSLDGTAAVFRANIFNLGSNHLNGNYISDKVFFDGGFTDPVTGVANPQDENPQKYDGWGQSATIEYDFAGMKFTSITGHEETHGYSRGDIDGGNLGGPGVIFFPSESQDGLDYLHQFTQEFHLATNDDKPLFWQVGAYYFSTKYQDTTYGYFIPGNPATSVRQSNVAWALFGSMTYKFSDKLSVTGGLRWTSDVKAMTANGPLDTITTPVRTEGDNVNWDVSAIYALDNDINVYARVATGFRGPSIQGRNIAFNSPPDNFSIANSEKIVSYEGGLKMLLDDHKLRLNWDVYAYHLTSPQFSAVGGALGNSIVLVNAKAGAAYGAEFDAEYDPDDNWSFTGGGSYNHTRIHDPLLSTSVCAQCTPLNTPDLAHPGDVLVNDNPFPNAPEYILNATAKYTYPLDSGASLYIYTDWYLQGYTNFFLYKSAEFYSNGNYEGGLRIGYVAPDNLWEAALYVRNITDKANVQGAIDFDDRTGFVGDPRVIGFQVTGHLN